MSEASRPEATIVLDAALAVVSAARARAAELGLSVAIAVVDRAGAPVATARMDGASLMAPELAAAKAWTAAAFLAPSEDLTETTKPEGEHWGFANTLAGRLCLLPGGVPILDGEEPIGAVGVSGGPVAEDRACAEAGAAAVAA
ncbi:MAG TPA: heme-binding protein [Solirubrobacterales bacterium]|nr:heme-binding protein [Solirubrobacterales bacterium]